jgi:hypothetical protein
VLVTKIAFKSIRKTFSSKILSWVNNLPDYEGNDDSSSGQALYMLSCAQSYGSFNGTIADKECFNPPRCSYASALAGNNYAPPIVTKCNIKEVLVPKSNTRGNSG